jgi:hypothetical protein
MPLSIVDGLSHKHYIWKMSEPSAVSQLLEVMENLDEGDSGQFFSWDGSRLPW